MNACGKNKCLSFCFSPRPLSLLILSCFFPFHFHPDSTLSSRRGSPVFSLKLSHLYVSQNEFQCSFFSVLISLFTLTISILGSSVKYLALFWSLTASVSLSAHDLCLPGPLRTLFHFRCLAKKCLRNLLSLTQCNCHLLQEAFLGLSHC